MKPFFSIITCTYNSQKFIKRNLESVNMQKYKNYEQIIIDGRSKDKTPIIVKKYMMKNPKISFFSRTAKGISNAFNIGLHKMKGKYVYFLNNDDFFYDNGVLADTASFLEKKDRDWIYGKINVLESTGESLGIFPERKIFQLASSRLLKYFNFIPHHAVFMKKSILDTYGGFREDLKVNMDYELYLRISKNTNWLFLDRIIANYLIRHDAASSSIRNRIMNMKSFEEIQALYLNSTERFIAKGANYFIDRYNKTYR